MTILREWFLRLIGTFRSPRSDADLQEELRLHMELAGGRGPVGGLAQAMENLRDQRGLPWLDGLARDVRYAVRTAVHNAGFSLVAAATLGVALAICLIVATIVNAYVVRPFPYPHADRLHSLALTAPGQPFLQGLDKLDWPALDDVVEQRIAWDLDMFYLLGGAYPESTPGAWVTPGFIEGFGVQAERGRALAAADFLPGAPPAVMISHRLWTRRFAGDPAIVGRTVKAYVSDRPDEAETLTIVGVLPRDFWHFNTYTDVIGPLRAPAYPYLLRLRDGVHPSAVADRVAALVRAARQDLPDGWQPSLVQMQSRYTEEMRPLLTALAASSVLVFFIACANVSVLLLVRSARRRHEIAIRLALGASRLRLARMLALEAVLVGGAASMLAFVTSAVLASGIGPLLEQRIGRRLPGGEAALMPDTTLALAAFVGGACVLVVLTLTPLLALWSTAVSPALKAGGRGTTDSRSTRRLRSVLIAGEIAAALALLVGSALMSQTSLRMLRLDPGFDAEGVTTAGVSLRARAYPQAPQRAEFYARMIQRLREEAPRRAVALSGSWPLQSVPPTRVQNASSEAVDAEVVRVTSGYFETLSIPFRDGATFTHQDRSGAEPVIVVSESLARRLWPDVRAVGQQLRVPTATEEQGAAPVLVSHRVVGVVGDVTHVGYDDGRVRPDGSQLDAYVPLLQAAGRFVFLYARGSAHDPDALRVSIAALDPEVATGQPESLAAALEETRNGPRQLAILLSAFAAFAAVLALVGVYSVIAYAVRQREREIGVRLVVGADPAAVTRLFVREGGVLVAGGLGAGLCAAAALGYVLRSQLFGVHPIAPGIFAGATALFGACGLLALWWPARRAARVEPASVLKEQ